LSETGRETEAHLVGSGGHDDRNPAGRTLGGHGGGRAARHDDIDLQADQLERHRSQLLERSVGSASLESHVAPLDVAELLELLLECRPPFGALAGVEVSDDRHPLAGLSARRQRGEQRCGEQRRRAQGHSSLHSSPRSCTSNVDESSDAFVERTRRVQDADKGQRQI